MKPVAIAALGRDQAAAGGQQSSKEGEAAASETTRRNRENEIVHAQTQRTS